eukprot:SAG31_NODE_5451_length_2531_cov_2.005345_2_plen_227_part_00
MPPLGSNAEWEAAAAAWDAAEAQLTGPATDVGGAAPRPCGASLRPPEMLRRPEAKRRRLLQRSSGRASFRVRPCLGMPTCDRSSRHILNTGTKFDSCLCTQVKPGCGPNQWQRGWGEPGQVSHCSSATTRTTAYMLFFMLLQQEQPHICCSSCCCTDLGADCAARAAPSTTKSLLLLRHQPGRPGSGSATGRTLPTLWRFRSRWGGAGAKSTPRLPNVAHCQILCC